MVFFATPLAAVVLGARPTEFENRRLAELPSPAQGWGFWQDMSPWATDHLAFRQSAVQATDFISRNVFGEPPQFDGRQNRSGPVGIDPDRESHNVVVPPVLEGKNGWLYLGDDVITRCNQTTSLDVTMTQLRRLRDGVESSGRQFVVVIAPDKTTMVPQHLPQSFPGKECTEKVTAELWRRVTEGEFIHDLRPALRDWAAELGKPVYPPLDAHWSDEGGVVMTKAIADAVDPAASASWRITPAKPWRVPADLPPLMGRSGEITGRYYALRPDGVANQAHPKAVNFTRFSAPLHLTSALGTGTIDTKVGLLGDSFTIRALPYLGAAFSDITITHAGRFDKKPAEAVAESLVTQEVIAVELVERTVAAGNNVLLKPAVVDTITSELARYPLR